MISNLKEIEIGIVDRGLKVALSDCPNILSYLPIRQLNCLYMNGLGLDMQYHITLFI